ncbi:FAD-dependent monooxygenase [Streptomyces sp. NPDC014734]|uniref:FAD-dependent monooxygenase n=1 Tax=Streptomyces sp. NPDC014734 TaxID=3364886 RepID=UPI0036F6606C
MNNHMRVAVVGAGVSGLAIATLLRRRGVHCELFEKSTTLSAVGAGIQLSPNGARILHELGAERLMRRRGITAQAIETRRWDNGGLLSRVPHGPACEARFQAPYYLIHRADLQACLVDLLPPGSLHLGRAVKDVIEQADGVELRLADGESVEADVVIGADGVHSAVRGAVVSDEPLFSGYSVYRALVPAEAVPSFAPDPRVMFWLGPDRHITYYPVSAGRTVHFSAVCAHPDGEGAPRTSDADAHRLLEEFDGWHVSVRQVLKAAESVTRWGLFDRDIAERYCLQRVALVGDAAHPMLPYLSQGAGQALEDARELSDCLMSGMDVPSALRRYDTRRRARTANVHRQSRLRATTFHLADGPLQRRRDAVLGSQNTLDHLEWLYGTPF